MQRRKILLAALLVSFYALGLRAQQPTAPPDSLNFYQRVILELEQRGFPVSTALENPEFVRQMETEGYSRDSLAYYYNLSKTQAARGVTAEPGFVAFMTKAYGDSIVLRWGPSTVDLWQKLNKTGYAIFRTEMLQDAAGKLRGVDTNSFRVLVDTFQAIKPWTLERISKYVQPSDSAAMVAVQALYGETFGGEATEGNLDFVERNRVRNMRFGFSLLMADRSAIAAEVLGLRYVDKNVQVNKTYIYYLIPLGNARELPTFALLKNDPKRNAKVEGLVAEAGDGVVKLSWPKKNNLFSEYWVERSEDEGKTWKKLTSDVIVFMDNDHPGPKTHDDDMLLSTEYDPSENANDHCIFRDSTVNDINYTYRVSGQTPFGDFCDYAYVKTKTGDLTPPPVPQVLRHEVDEKSNLATLEWSMDYDAELLNDLAGFTVWEASHPDSAYTQVSPQLGPAVRAFQSPKPLEKEQTHYYILKAFDKKGNETVTFPLYMHVIDDIAPAAPYNPSYVIDSTGVVTLVWEHNKEADLLGYRVYFTNSLKDELTQLTPAPISINLFRDTLELVTLTEKVYYRIQAVDRSQNRSEFSVVIEVQKPDIIPPVTPVLRYPEMNDTLIQLRWKPSSSEDVAQHILYRRVYQNNEEWKELAVLGARDTSYRDESSVEEVLYEYSIRAVDDAGLYSELAFPVKARRWFGGKINTVENLQARYEDSTQTIQLHWTFSPPTAGLLKGVDYVYSIYRSQGAAPMLRYRTIEGRTTSFSDLKVKANETYHYALMVVFNNGKTSALSEQQSVVVKKE